MEQRWGPAWALVFALGCGAPGGGDADAPHFIGGALDGASADVHVSDGRSPDRSLALDAAPEPDARFEGDVALARSDGASERDGNLDTRGDVAVDAASSDLGAPDPDGALDAQVVPEFDGGDASTADVGSRDVSNRAPDPDGAPPDPDAAPLDPDVAVLVPDAAPPAPDAAPEPAYPAGPYGVNVGDVLADLEFEGPDGAPWFLSEAREGARLLLVATVAAWCGVCARKMAPTSEFADRLAARGLVVVVAVFENANFDPARGADAAAWRERHQLAGPVVADPRRALDPYFRPLRREKYLLVQADTMEIIRISPTFVPEDAAAVAEAWLDAH